MNRILAGLAISTAAVSMAAAPAQAATPKDPIATLKQQFRPDTGVKFIDRVTLQVKGNKEYLARRTGAYEFGTSGITASDMSGTLFPDQAREEKEQFGLGEPERTIRVGRTAYLSGGVLSGRLEEGKTWYKLPNGPAGGVVGNFAQPVNPVEPATLQALLKTGKATKDGYAGAITYRELYKNSPWARGNVFPGAKMDAKTLKSVIKWRLTLDAKGLPSRVVTSISASTILGGKPGKDTLTSDTRFTDWGTPVDIQAPPADQVTTKFKDEGTDTPELPDGPILSGDQVEALLGK
ncbi:hypothetical protein [Nonomuraea longicatena]|uniref:Lipoprotein n=1 Tax=Nonomuraea longicatena TaxID=83682 RepID=A0ABP3ZK47_9ACTN